MQVSKACTHLSYISFWHSAEEPADEKKEKTKKDLKEEIQNFQKELEKKGPTHNDEFQKAHASLKIQCRKGHWSIFLEKLASDATVECAACKMLVDKYVHQIDASPPAEEVPQQPDLEPRMRGRPRRGETIDDQFLLKYLKCKRAHIYQVTPKSEFEFEYFCVPCQKTIPFFRNALTYVLKHERISKAHRKGLELLNIDPNTFEIDSRSLERKPCSGICISDLTEDTCGQMSKLTESIQIWYAAGMPYVSSANKALLVEQSSWKMDGDHLICRHSNCTGTPAINGCHVCKVLVQDEKLPAEIAKWAYKIDLGFLANACAYWTEAERQKHITDMMSRDYKQLGLAGGDLESLLQMSSRQIVLNVRKSWESVPRRKRNGSYDTFINLHIAGLADYGGQEDSPEKEIFANLVSKYRTALEDGSCIEDVPRQQCSSVHFAAFSFMSHHVPAFPSCFTFGNFLLGWNISSYLMLPLG